jgi:hypothetical protein
MKKLVFPAVIAMCIMASCNGDKLKQAESDNEQLQGELTEQRAIQDSLLVLFNDITEGMSQIKDLEKIVSSPTNLSGESAERKQQIKNDMMAIQKALQERRERLAQLEEQLSKSSTENKTLLRTIENLKAQIADQQTEIATLTNQLASANIKIETLGNQVTSLNQSVDSMNTVTANAREAEAKAAAEAKRMEAEANTVYYVIGTNKELKEHKILSGGGLFRKTKTLAGNYDVSYFTRADRRTLTTIPLHSKKAKVMTSQPSDSYTISEQGGQKVLTITNPTRFWAVSNFLVVKVD